MADPRHLNVFSGPTALADSLDPDKQPYFPLIELPPDLNPLAGDRVRIFAKAMHQHPLGNVKALPALRMLREADAARPLAGESLIENSSGNTVASLAVLGRLFGVARTRAVVSHEVTPGKLQLLRLFGVEVQVNEEPICPDPHDATSGIHLAAQKGAEPGWRNPGQYDNAANPAAHEAWTGPQIWEQTAGAVTVFCCGLGTTGTAVGAGGYLKRRVPQLARIGVVRAPNNPVPGVRTENLLREIAFDWRGAVDRLVEVGTVDAYRESLALIRRGIVCGPSAGFAYAGLLRFLEEAREAGGLDALRNAAGEVVAVFVCPDSPLPYLDEYFSCLDAAHFPEIVGEELLLHRAARPRRAPAMATALDAAAAYGRLYDMPAPALARAVAAGTAAMRPGVALLDLRSAEDFAHFHLIGAERLEYRDALRDVDNIAAVLAGRTAIVICAHGARSQVLAGLLRQHGVDAWSVAGGTTEWSRRHLPRWRADACRVRDRT